MKQEVVDKRHDNSSGVVGVVLGILSVVFFIIPLLGLVLGIVGVVFAFKQHRASPNKWSKAGLWLCWIGIIIGAVWSVYYIKGIIEFTRQYQQQIQALQSAGGAGGVDLNAYASGN